MYSELKDIVYSIESELTGQDLYAKRQLLQDVISETRDLLTDVEDQIRVKESNDING